MPPSPIARLRKICLAFPGAHEVEAWGEATFRVNNKLFAMYARGGTHHAEVDSVWIKATPINQSFIIAGNPKRYFLPPYVGTSGWFGAKLEGRVNWTQIADLLRDAYDLTVTKNNSPTTRPAGSVTVAEKQRRAARQARRR
jgi:predicted DNA-binding protein (MmcQ/YjbR family)